MNELSIPGINLSLCGEDPPEARVLPGGGFFQGEQINY